MRSAPLLLAAISLLQAKGMEPIGFLRSAMRETVSNRSNQIILLGASAAVAGLRVYDDDVARWRKNHAMMPETASQFFDGYGGGGAYPAAGVVMVVHSALVEKERGPAAVERAGALYAALGLTAGITDLLKVAVGRERPNGEGNRSFPSGHTSGSFCLAGFAHEMYGAGVGAPLYLIAGAVGLQRIHDNRHWLTDVIAGGALGTMIGRGFGKAWREKRAKGVAVATQGGGVQVSLAWPLD